MAFQREQERQESVSAQDVSPASASSQPNEPPPVSSRTHRPQLSADGKAFFQSRPNVNFADRPRSPTNVSLDGQLSPAATDRVFPIRSVVSVDPTPTPTPRSETTGNSYFRTTAQARRQSGSSSNGPHASTTARPDRRTSGDRTNLSKGNDDQEEPKSRQNSTSIAAEFVSRNAPSQSTETASVSSEQATGSGSPSERPSPTRAASFKNEDAAAGLVTARFKHVVTDEGHAVITGRDGDVLQRCEDEPIHIPGAVQGFGLLIALEEVQEGKLIVRVVSENSRRMIGYSPKQLFGLDSFTDILSEEQADNLLDHVDFIRDEDADVVLNGPEVFTMAIRTPQRKNHKLWCAMHMDERNPGLIICEFELEDDVENPLVPPNDMTPEPPEDTLDSQPTEEEYEESTHVTSKPLRVLRSARKRKGEAAAMEVFNIMSQVQEQLASAPNLEKFLKILVGVIKELTGFHRVMIYQFDQNWNGRVVTELVDPRSTKDLYRGLNFPASDIPKQARDLYRINKVRMLYDRDLETARLVCRTIEDLETPLDLTHSYLRAMSPIHIKYLANMAVRSSMSISINAFEELWGLIACHSYGAKGMRVSFPIRKMCRLVGDSASRNIERLSYASRLQARKLINTVPTQSNPSGYIIASSEDLLKLFDADFGLLSIRGETKIMGNLEHSQEALAMLEYLRMRSITNVMTSQDIKVDFPDLRYPPGFQVIAGLLLVPLSVSGQDFFVFFRKGVLREVKWAGNPYEKFIKEGTEGYLEPRKSFRTWSETVVGKCRDWTEEEIETAAVLCLVYGKFIEVWRQKEAALQNSQLNRLLLANSAHEVRTPLNAIINYLEIALEGSLDQETRDNLAKSHSASKSLIYVINDLLDLTKTEEGVALVKDEVFDIKATLAEATSMFRNDAKRKGIGYDVVNCPGLPSSVIGDQRRVRQAISNITANAIQNTTKGSVIVECSIVRREEQKCELEVSVTDTGCGMNTKKLDQLFRELEQVQTESLVDPALGDAKALPELSKKQDGETLGLGLAVVARIVRNMNGQLRLKSEEGKGSRFVIQFPFDLPDTEPEQQAIEPASPPGSITPLALKPSEPSTPPIAPDGEVTLIERGSAQRRASQELRPGNGMSRMNSGDSVNSKVSINSMQSAVSNVSFTSAHSSKSEADRLIEAMQEPHRVDGWQESDSVKRSGSSRRRIASASSPRPALNKRHTHSTGMVDATGSPAKTRPKSLESGTSELQTPARVTSAPRQLQVSEQRKGRSGEAVVTDQGMPIRPVRIQDDETVSPSANTKASSTVTGPTQALQMSSSLPASHSPQSADHMCILVAEDDPVNSRIIQKRLEKLGHEVWLTINGEECASAYCDRSDSFDIVLMDMQMPIVDGLTSTKMIRSFEKTHPDHRLSSRAALNGRVPIIAVSASLVEKDRQVYIDAGFDGWILKPIAFNRLTELGKGIVDKKVRKENLYQPGAWESGGWFDEGNQDAFAAETRPSQQPPKVAPGVALPSEGMKIAAASDNPFIREENESEQTREQYRLTTDVPSAPKAATMPELRRKLRDTDSSEETITAAQPTASPQPLSPNLEPS